MTNSYRKLLTTKNLIIVICTTCLYVIVILFQAVPLITKSYLLNQSDLYKIDTVKMLSRAFYINSAKMSTSGIEFKDTKNKTFRIKGSAWNTLRDQKNFLTHCSTTIYL